MTGSTRGTHDRKLGDEWNDWRGDADPRDRDIDEKVSTFLSLASGMLFVSVALLLLGWFMIKPRFEQIDPLFAQMTGWLLAGIAAGFVLVAFFEGSLLIRRGRSLLPYPWSEKCFLFLLPGSLWLGGKFGISKDRVGNSFIKIHNIITKSHVGRQSRGRLLVLLPRCLSKEARQELTGRLSGDDYKIFTATGGEEAREAIRQYRPASILAIACERDLMSGIKDVADKIPVIAIPNKRPEGPCKNTDISIPELEAALKVLRGERAEKQF